MRTWDWKAIWWVVGGLVGLALIIWLVADCNRSRKSDMLDCMDDRFYFYAQFTYRGDEAFYTITEEELPYLARDCWEATQ